MRTFFEQIKIQLAKSTDFVVVIFVFFLVHHLHYAANFAPSENPKIFSLIGVISLAFLIQILLHFREELKLSFNGWMILISIFLISMFVSSLNSNNVFISIFGNPEMPTGGLYSYIGVFLTALYFAFRKNEIKLLFVFKVIALCGFSVAVFGILQRFGYDFIKNWPIETVMKRSSSTIGNPVPYGIFLCATITATFTLLLLELAVRKINFIVLFATLIQLIGLWFSGSRAPIFFTFLILVGLSFILIFLNLQKNQNPLANLKLSFKKIGLFTSIAIAFGFSIYVLKDGIKDSTTSRMQSLPILESLKDRLSVGMAGVRHTVENKPILGYGPAMFSHVYGLAKPKSHNQNYGWGETMLRSHNEISEIFVSQGVLGLLAFLLILIYVPFQFYRNILISSNIQEKMKWCGLFAVLIGYFLNSFFMFYYLPNLILVSVLPVFLFDDHLTTKISFNRIVGLFRFTCVLLLLSFFSQNLQFHLGNLKLSQAEAAFRKMDLKTSFAMIYEAMEHNPYETSYDCSVLSYFGIIGLQNPKEILYPSNKEAIQTSIRRCYQAGAQFNYRVSLLSDNVFFLARYDRQLLPQAIDFSKKAIDLAPNDVRTYIGFAARLFEFDRLSEAKEVAMQGLELRFEAFDFHALLLEIAYKNENLDEAMQVIDRLAENILQRYPFKTLTPDFRIDDMISLAKSKGHLSGVLKLDEVREHMKKNGAIFDRPKSTN